MSRAQRRLLAEETVAIVELGVYTSPSGQTVDLSSEIHGCLESTRYLTPEALATLRDRVLSQPAEHSSIEIEVRNETTLAGIARLLRDGAPSVAALNFASARNPGGGFLNGSLAQEESLAMSSALYASQQRAWTFYKRHRNDPSLLYSDAMILSPGCSIFRDDAGNLLESPHRASFLTSAAPNAGAIATNRPEDLQRISETLRQRAEFVLALAASEGYRHLVLGAWGCGVFRNDPQLVAGVFAGHLIDGPWRGRFERVVFSVLDNTPRRETIGAFESALK